MLKLSHYSGGAGFSLVELMVGIAILAVTMTLAIPSYSVWMQNTRIRTAAESIQNGLQLARAEAVQRNTKIEFLLDGTHSGWSVGCKDPAGDCPAEIQSHPASEGSSVDITVTTTPVDSDSLVFNRFGRISTDATDPKPFIQMDINSSKLSVTDARPLRVTIGVGGNARLCDPAASDSRKC